MAVASVASGLPLWDAPPAMAELVMDVLEDQAKRRDIGSR